MSKKLFVIILGLFLGVLSLIQVIPGSGTQSPGPSSTIFADQFTNLQTAISTLPATGGTVYLRASPTSYACPSSIPNNVSLVGLAASEDRTFLANLGVLPVNVVTQVKIGPCDSPIVMGGQNITLKGITLDYDNSGFGFTCNNCEGIHLEDVNVINAGSTAAGAAGAAVAFTSSTKNSVSNKMDTVKVHCTMVVNQFCSAAFFIGSSGVGAVTNNNFTNLSANGFMRCGVEIEANSDTNTWNMGELNPEEPGTGLIAGTSAFCFNQLNPTVEVDANANLFIGWQQTSAMPTSGFQYMWSAGQSSGHVFIFSDTPPPPTNYHVVGGSPIPPAVLTQTLSPFGRTTFYTDYFSAAGGLTFTETNAPTPGAGLDACYGDSAMHKVQCNYNNSAFFPMSQAIANGTSVLTNVLVGAGACQTAVSTAASGVANTDAMEWAFSSAPTGASDGVLITNAWATAGHVNFQRCNPTAGNITPTGLTINWRVVR